MTAAPRLMAAVHACRKQVAGLDDEAAWRAFLTRVAGEESLRAMDGRRMGLVLDALHKAGAPRKAGSRAGKAALDDRPQVRMARGLWIELHRDGAVRDPSERALEAFAKRVTGKHKLAWCAPRDLNKLVEALKDWRDRVDGNDPVVRVAEGMTIHERETRDQALVRALWDALAEAGAFRTGAMARMDTWLSRHFRVANTAALEAKAAAEAVAQLGTWLRKEVRAQRDSAAAAADEPEAG